MGVFSKVTGTDLKDCIDGNNKIFFIVAENQAGKAIGKRGFNVKILEKELKKNVRIVEYSANPTEFIKNLIYPNKITGVEENEGTYVLTPIDTVTRSMLIGRGAVNLREYEKICKRFFNITELRVK